MAEKRQDYKIVESVQTFRLSFLKPTANFIGVSQLMPGIRSITHVMTSDMAIRRDTITFVLVAKVDVRVRPDIRLFYDLRGWSDKPPQISHGCISTSREHYTQEMRM